MFELRGLKNASVSKSTASNGTATMTLYGTEMFLAATTRTPTAGLVGMGTRLATSTAVSRALHVCRAKTPPFLFAHSIGAANTSAAARADSARHATRDARRIVLIAVLGPDAARLSINVRRWDGQSLLDSFGVTAVRLATTRANGMRGPTWGSACSGPVRCSTSL